LLMYTTGLAQRFLEKRLEIDPSEPARGSIIEKKEEKGLGTTLDVILYNGTLRTNDTVAFATASGVSTAKIRALLKPRPLQELRESSGKFVYIEMASAAAGLKLSGNGFDDALPGSLILSVNSAGYEKEIATEIKEVFSVDKTGLVLKTDTIGSLEALSRLLSNAGIKISKKGLGTVNKRDVLDAFAMRAMDPYGSVVLAFSVGIEDDARLESEAAGVNILSGSIIYKVLDDYKEWAEKEKQKDKASLEKSLTFPGVVKVLPNYCFRVSHPAVFGVGVEAGRIKPSYLLMKKNGDRIGRVKEIQDNALKLEEAKKGANVAISMDDITFGRQVKENDVLYTFISDEDIRTLRFKYAYLLDDEDMDILKAIEAINK
ncbi:MAG: translation initiation factor IF-2, partial [Candidatus Micrarchaeota archaeon]|nr:translation initiation factor IF-2 [Candidatus Micrarchaeota archaeon]